MPAPPVVSDQPPKACGNPGYSVPLHLVQQFPVVQFYGNPGQPVPRETVSQGTVVRGVLSRFPQQYDRYPINYGNMSGLGVVKTIKPPIKQDQVSLPLPSPVRQSTVFGVVAGSALAIAASVALFMYLKKKG